MFKARQRRSEWFDFPAIQRVSGDQDLGPSDVDTGLNGFGPECRKKRREDASVLECAERGDVQLWNPSGQNHHTIAFADAQTFQNVREAARFVAEQCAGNPATPPFSPIRQRPSHVSIAARTVRSVQALMASRHTSVPDDHLGADAAQVRFKFRVGVGAVFAPR